MSDNLKPSILLVAQPDTLPGVVGEIIMIVLNTKTPVTTLILAVATPETVIEVVMEKFGSVQFSDLPAWLSLKDGHLSQLFEA